MTLPAAVIHARLDADPSDSGARLLLAEHLAEHGDAEQARGLRWLAANNKWPEPGWGWWFERQHQPLKHSLPDELENDSTGGLCIRECAESAFCAALAATKRSE